MEDKKNNTKFNDYINNIENIVFEGGGIKGYVYISCLKEIIKNNPNFMNNIKGFAGTSIGSLMAAMFALKMDILEVEEKIIEISREDIYDYGSCCKSKLKALYNFYNFFGLIHGDVWEKILRNMFLEKSKECGLTRDLTFNDVYLIYETNLVIPAVNLNTEKIVWFSKDKTPNVPIYKAIACSSNIPGVFKPRKYDFNPDKENNKDLIVDGGLIVNYPIFVFDEININDPFKSKKCNMKTLGLKIMVESDEAKEEGTFHQEIKSVGNFSLNLINLLNDQLNKKHIKKNDWKRTLPILCPNFHISDLSLTDDKIEKLDEAGLIAFNKFKERFN